MTQKAEILHQLHDYNERIQQHEDAIERVYAEKFEFVYSLIRNVLSPLHDDTTTIAIATKLQTIFPVIMRANTAMYFYSQLEKVVDSFKDVTLRAAKCWIHHDPPERQLTIHNIRTYGKPIPRLNLIFTIREYPGVYVGVGDQAYHLQQQQQQQQQQQHLGATSWEAATPSFPSPLLPFPKPGLSEKTNVRLQEIHQRFPNASIVQVEEWIDRLEILLKVHN